MKSVTTTAIRRAIIISSWLVLLCIISACQRQLVPSVQLQPEENLINIISELKFHQKDDLYRFSYPRDLAGHNIFKATIVRLANYERLFPGKFPDIVAFSYGLAYEKLRDFKSAMNYYQQVADMESPLSDEAEQRLAVVKEFASVMSSSSSAGSIADYISEAGNRISALRELIKRYQGQEYEPLARLALEREQVALAHYLWLNRYVIPEGTRRAIELIKTIIEEHLESKDYYAHQLRLADCYFQLAKDYVDLTPPESAEFDEAEFVELINTAADLYYAISEADGYREKEEGQAKLQALFSFANKVKRKM